MYGKARSKLQDCQAERTSFEIRGTARDTFFDQTSRRGRKSGLDDVQNLNLVANDRKSHSSCHGCEKAEHACLHAACMRRTPIRRARQLLRLAAELGKYQGFFLAHREPMCTMHVAQGLRIIAPRLSRSVPEYVRYHDVLCKAVLGTKTARASFEIAQRSFAPRILAPRDMRFRFRFRFPTALSAAEKLLD